MTSRIGNDPAPLMTLRSISNHRGFTFIEIMVTIIILSSGLLIVYKAFLTSLDQMATITNRLYVNNVIDNRVHEIEKMYRLYGSFQFDMNFRQEVNVGPKELILKQEMNISEVEDLLNLYQLDLELGWKERDRNYSVSRSAYLSNFAPIHKN